MSVKGKRGYSSHYTERGRLRFTKKGGLVKASCGRCRMPIRIKEHSTHLCNNCSYSIRQSKASYLSF